MCKTNVKNLGTFVNFYEF